MTAESHVRTTLVVSEGVSDGWDHLQGERLKAPNDARYDYTGVVTAEKNFWLS